jgi:hypothetical protein
MKSTYFKALLFFSLSFLAYGYSNAIENSHLKFTTDLTWASKYMNGGFKIGGDEPVWQFAGKTDLYSSGFSFMFWTAMQSDRNKKQYDEQDFFLLYSYDFLKDSRSTINFHGFYDYWLFPHTEPTQDDFGVVVSNKQKHGNKFQIGFSMPNLIPFADSYLVPSYNIYRWLFWEQDRADLNRSGTQDEFLLEYSRAIPLFIPGATYQYAGATASMNYHDGAFEVKPGWTHSTASLLAGVYALKSIFSLSLNHQWTYEKTLNPRNEFWTTLSYIKKF